MNIPFFNKKGRVISPSLLLYIAKSNLLSKKLRTGLTLAGVTIGIGAIFFLLSFGLGIQKIVTDEIVGNQSIKSIDVTSPNSQVLSLDADELNRFSELANVQSVGGAFLVPGILESSGAEVDTVVYGVDTAFQNISNLTLTNGRLLDKEDNRSVVMNDAALEAIGITDLQQAVGAEIIINVPIKTSKGTSDFIDTYEVVGVISSGSGSEIFIPSHLLAEQGLTSFSSVKLVVTSNQDVSGVRTQIQALGFETVSPIDTIDQINQIFRYFNVILAGFGAIGMIVAVLGMFNTLTISLLERTKEIGLMMALGARSRDMKQLFVLEALLLSILGACMGVLGALVLGSLMNLGLNLYASSRGVADSFNLFSTPWWLMLGMIVFMAIVGLLVVYYPAKRAETISPIEALRRE
jgi:ABC-type antimicrobial peptide transport system permease subunit